MPRRITWNRDPWYRGEYDVGGKDQAFQLMLTDAIDMSLWHEVMAILQLGAIDNTIDKARDSATSGGTYADTSGKAITQLTGGTRDNNTYVISLKSEELTGSGRYVRPRVTVGNGTSNFGCVIVLGAPRFGPATDDDLAQVGQVVS